MPRRNKLLAVAGVLIGAALAAWYYLTSAIDTPTSRPAPPDPVAMTAPAPVPAGTMLYLYDAPESALDRRYLYQWEILKTALERTRPKWGDYRMQTAEFMSERRQSFELEHATGALTVMYLDAIPEYEKQLIPVRIPVDKNLGGFRVFLIRKEDQPKFSAVNSLTDLKKFKIGAGLGWLDVDILRANGFDVVTGSSYDGLFDMEANGRFDAFSRGTVEILDEYAERKDKLPNLAIEDSFILYIALPMYFWFPKTPEGQRLADRAREGMLMMIEDGTYDQIFRKYQQYKIDQLHLKTRKIFKIINPFVAPETPFEDSRLWFDPLADK